MTTINTHQGVNIDGGWIIYRNSINAFRTVLTGLDTSAIVFSMEFYSAGGSVAKLTLTEASGAITNDDAGTIDYSLSVANLVTLPRDRYFFVIKYTTGGNTYPLAQGFTNITSETNPGTTLTSVTIPVSVSSTQINMTVTMTGGSAGAWGGITGTLSNQIDLQSALDAKADNSDLTSHTSNTSNPHSVTKTQVGLANVDNTSDANKPVSTATQVALDLKVPTTRTVNGQALSANIVIPHSLRYKAVNGRLLSAAVCSTTSTTVAVVANTLICYPLIIDKAVTFTNIKIEVTTNVASTKVRCGIYADNGSCYPGALVAGSDTGEFDTASIGVKTSPDVSITLTPGLYWLALNANGAPTLRGMSNIAHANILGLDPTALNAIGCGYRDTLAYAALPSTYPASQPILSNNASPFVALLIV